VKAFQIQKPGSGTVIDTPELRVPNAGEVLLRVNLVGMCGTDLTTFRGGNAMVTFPRIPGHEIAATVVEGADDIIPSFRKSCLLRSIVVFFASRHCTLSTTMAAPARQRFQCCLPRGRVGIDVFQESIPQSDLHRRPGGVFCLMPASERR
jgi:NADPH:quinone reductase-like Zn-dependent oxidoreductase